MNEEEQTAYIIQHLSTGDDPKDLILDLCEKSNLSWPEAEALVRQVQEEKRGVITRKQLPLLFAVALVIFLAGLVMIGSSIYTISSEVSLAQLDPTVQALEQNLDAMQRLYYFFTFILEEGGKALASLILGVAMVIGSLVGMRDTWANVLTK